MLSRPPERQPMPERISMTQRAVLNYAARELGRYLCTLDIVEVRGWAGTQVDMSVLLPADFDLNPEAAGIGSLKHGWVKRRAIEALEGMGPTHWDELLHMMDDMAGAVRSATQDPDQIESADYLQDMIGLLLDPAQNHGSSWYYMQMERMRDILVRKLGSA